jgi:hypothetical protein
MRGNSCIDSSSAQRLLLFASIHSHLIYSSQQMREFKLKTFKNLKHLFARRENAIDFFLLFSRLSLPYTFFSIICFVHFVLFLCILSFLLAFHSSFLTHMHYNVNVSLALSISLFFPIGVLELKASVVTFLGLKNAAYLDSHCISSSSSINRLIM